MRTLLANIFSNGGASKFFWSMLSLLATGFLGWMTYISVAIWEVKADQKVQKTEKQYIKEDVKEVKDDVKDVKKDMKDVKKVLYEIAGKL